jgi:hypothetical protein
MNDLKVEDLLLMLMAQRGNPRDHSANLNLFKTLFEREVGGINLIFNLLSGVSVAFFITMIGTIVSKSNNISVSTLDTSFWVTIIVAILALALTVFSIRQIRNRRQQLRQRYLSLIRLYYYLDAVT